MAADLAILAEAKGALAVTLVEEAWEEEWAEATAEAATVD
jgi:hypothetical protein